MSHKDVWNAFVRLGRAAIGNKDLNHEIFVLIGLKVCQRRVHQRNLRSTEQQIREQEKHFLLLLFGSDVAVN